MTVVVSGIRVVATIHAAERALLRVPELAGADRSRASFWVELSVGRALRDGRKAKTCPRWCYDSDGRRSKARSEGTTRFVWNEEETVAMLVRRTRDRDDVTRQVWLVVTVLVCIEGEAVA